MNFALGSEVTWRSMDELSCWVWQGLQLLSSAQGLVSLVFKIYKTPQCLALKFTVKRCCQTRVGIRIGALKIFLSVCAHTHVYTYIQRPESNLWESVLPCHVHPRDGTHSGYVWQQMLLNLFKPSRTTLCPLVVILSVE